jgi:formylmethanofuran dehydrogenase subunit E
MDRCQICQEPIWKSRWPESRDKVMPKFICHFCFSNLKGGDYEPEVPRKSPLFVCDRCGEIVESAKSTDSGWLCEDCQE